jgi:hypothetical protein
VVVTRGQQTLGKEPPQERLAAFGDSRKSVGSRNGQIGRHGF